MKTIIEDVLLYLRADPGIQRLRHPERYLPEHPGWRFVVGWGLLYLLYLCLGGLLLIAGGFYSI